MFSGQSMKKQIVTVLVGLSLPVLVGIVALANPQGVPHVGGGVLLACGRHPTFSPTIFRIRGSVVENLSDHFTTARGTAETTDREYVLRFPLGASRAVELYRINRYTGVLQRSIELNAVPEGDTAWETCLPYDKHPL
jgi:hypothetical protein